MRRMFAYDAGEWSSRVVVSKLALLGGARRRRSLPVGLGVFERLHCLVEVLLTGHSSLEKLALPLYFLGVVVVCRLLLCFRAALLIDGRLLLQRINRHPCLSSTYVIARLYQDA